MTILFQVISTGIASYICMSIGIMFAWPSSTLQLFSSANTTLNRPMTETEGSLLGSLSSISALISIPLVSYFAETLGRKYCCMLFTVIHIISWLIITVCYKVEAILAASFLFGICRCISLVVPIYISEICQTSIRGAMTSSAMIFRSVGMLVSYLMGGCLSYDVMNYVCLSMTVLGVVFVSFLKESPIHLMRKGHENEAKRAIAFYRGTSINSILVEEEVKTLRRALNPDLGGRILSSSRMTEEKELIKKRGSFKGRLTTFISYMDSLTTPLQNHDVTELQLRMDATPEEEKLNSDVKENPKLSWWQFFKKSRSTRRALFMIAVIDMASLFQGRMLLQVYAEPLFAEAVPSISPTICSVFFTTVTIMSGFIGAFLVERAGRRLLMIYASFCTGVCCVLLGTQIQLHWGPHWVTVTFMFIYGVTYTCGAGTVPCVLFAEIFLPEIKSVAVIIQVEWFMVCSFIVLFIYNPIVTAIGLGPVFYFFAVACFFSVIFCFFFLPETKGLTVDVIQTLFAKRNIRRQNDEITF